MVENLTKNIQEAAWFATPKYQTPQGKGNHPQLKKRLQKKTTTEAMTAR